MALAENQNDSKTTLVEELGDALDDLLQQMNEGQRKGTKRVSARDREPDLIERAGLLLTEAKAQARGLAHRNRVAEKRRVEGARRKGMSRGSRTQGLGRLHPRL